jgi:tRNA (guanine6-N2)-methyltransferase
VPEPPTDEVPDAGSGAARAAGAPTGPGADHETPDVTGPTGGAADPQDAGAVLAAARAARPAGEGRPVPAWASCAPGMEEEAARELGALGWEVIRPPGEGDVVGTATREVLAATLGWSRTVRGAHLLLADTCLPAVPPPGEHADGTALTGALADALADVEVPAWPTDASVAVRAHRHGDHPFTSVQLGAAAATVLLGAYTRTTGRRPRVDLDHPDLELTVALSGRRLLVGVALHHIGLARRGWRRASHRAGLDATVAAALLLRAGWSADEVLLDPCCGAGTVLVEAGLAGTHHPPHGATSGLAGGRVTGGHATGARLRLHGRDRRGAALRDAATNLAVAGLADAAVLARADLRRELDAPPVDVVVANPPFGIRVGHRADVVELTRTGIGRLAGRLTPRGRILWLTPDAGLVRAAAADADLVVRRADPVRLGDLEVHAMLLARHD